MRRHRNLRHADCDAAGARCNCEHIGFDDLGHGVRKSRSGAAGAGRTNGFDVRNLAARYSVKLIRILAIESSCDETAAAVMKNETQVLSSVIASQFPVHGRNWLAITEESTCVSFF